MSEGDPGQHHGMHATTLEVALNGGRPDDWHPRIPRTPVDIAGAARDAVAAGAGVLHLHPHDADGRETLDAAPVSATLSAVRAACPGVPISLSTSAEIEPDPERRRALVSEWTDLPDLVTANQGEDEIVPLCEDLLARGVGIEAGLLEAADAEAFVETELPFRCTRAMIEPLDTEPERAVAHAGEMVFVLASAGIELEQVHHGDGIASWAVNARALELGHGIRTGIEDTPVLPDGSPAADNAALVHAAAALISAA